jgi:hypothetical protein
VTVHLLEDGAVFVEEVQENAPAQRAQHCHSSSY